METVRLASMAMATRFELVIRSEGDPVWLRAIGEEALAEVSRLDGQLSFYSPRSDVSRVNRGAYAKPVRVSAGFFALLSLVQDLHGATLGAFDPTVGPLMRLWGFAGGGVRVPAPHEIDRVMDRVGMEHVRLDPVARTVQFDREGAEIDLGAIGKGYALDEVVQILQEAGVHHAFVHGGTSSMKAIGSSAEGPGWNVGVAAPIAGVIGPYEADEILTTTCLYDTSLAVSDVRGKWFEHEDGFTGHVLDPRTGVGAGKACLSAVEYPSATIADALSTAMLVAGSEGRAAIRSAFPGARFLFATAPGDAPPAIEFSDFDSHR